MESLFFWIFAATSIALAALVVFHRQPIACALALAATLFSTAALFITLEAFFLAVVQVIVYVGAVVILFTFIVMLLNSSEEQKRKRSWIQIGGIGLLVILFAIFFSGVIAGVSNANTSLVWKDQIMGENIRKIGKLLFAGYMLPFLTTGILLLLTTLGVVLLNKKDHSQ